MPIELDPAWEYYQADEEVLSLIEDSGRGIEGDEARGERHGWNGNPGYSTAACRHGRRIGERQTKQVVFTFLYCCTRMGLDEIASKLSVNRKTLNNWRSWIGLKGRYKPRIRGEV
jgi:DNA invertase Pin-like site-specific DNA recombinase